MSKIIKLDASRRKPRPPEENAVSGCEHRLVTAYTAFRTVRCSICGTLLDPFDVLVDLLKGHVPPTDPSREEKRLLAEVARRKKTS